VTGHPGSTDRLLTMAQLQFQRDLAIPTRLKMYDSRLAALARYSARGKENARRAQGFCSSLENAKKAVTGEYEALKNPALFKRKAAAEKALRARARSAGSAWDRIRTARQRLRGGFRPYVYQRLSGHRLPSISDTIVRFVAEVRKPNEKRYEEFRDSALESLRFRLLSPAPIYTDLEEVLLAHGLRESLEALGPRDPYIKAVLAGATPERAAKKAAAGTRLGDPKFRKKLLDGGPQAILASNDPMISLSRRADPFYRKRRGWFEDKVESVETVEGNRIAKARFANYGKSLYPDATFTLRLSYGKACGYKWGKTQVPFKTTFYGLYDRANSFDNLPPFDLSRKVAAARAKVNLWTPLNFVSTHDIIGGNSGSPVITRKAELVGLIFDGNIQSLGARYSYAEGAGRAVSVHAGAIIESLKHIYGMSKLIRELS